jgi:hypothetical protein
MVVTTSVRDGSDTRRWHERTDQCRVRRLRPLFGRRRPGLDCDNPVPWVCNRCNVEWFGTCGDRRASRCRSCAGRHRRRVRAIALSGAAGNSLRSYFITLTPPGDQVHCKRPGCDGAPTCGHELCRCTPEGGTDLATWNPSHGRRWNHFVTSLRREAPDVHYMRGCEVQDGKRRTDNKHGRLGLHDHVIVRTKHALDERLIRRLAMNAGYGHSIKIDEMAPASTREAEYVSKYVGKSADQRWDVPWRAQVVNVETGEITTPLVKARYRTWSASRQWGITMKQLRAEAAVRARALDEAMAGGHEAEAAVALLRSMLGAELLTNDDTPPAPS